MAVCDWPFVNGTQHVISLCKLIPAWDGARMCIKMKAKYLEAEIKFAPSHTQKKLHKKRNYRAEIESIIVESWDRQEHDPNPGCKSRNWTSQGCQVMFLQCQSTSPGLCSHISELGL